MMKRQIVFWTGLFLLTLSFLYITPTFAEGIPYRIRKGDTLASIAKRYHVEIGALKEANNIKGSTLKVGSTLLIPEVKQAKIRHGVNSTYRVQKGDTLRVIAQKSGISIEELAKINHLSTKSKLKPGQVLTLKVRASDKKRGKTTPQEVEEEDLMDNVPDTLVLTEIEPAPASDGEPLGKWKDPDERSFLVKVATAFLGAPYRLGGNSVRGLDCSSFVKKIYQLFGVSLPRTAREQAAVGMRVSRDQLEIGDLVFFNTKRPFGHVGIYIGDNKFVHASSVNRVVRIDSLSEPYFDKRFAKAVRLKTIEDHI